MCLSSKAIDLRVAYLKASFYSGVQVEEVGNTAVFKALRSLFQRLTHEFYARKDGSKARIDGDTAKMKYAIGFSDMERKIIVNFDHVSQSVPGTLEIRKQIGHLTLAGEQHLRYDLPKRASR